jgi:superfamily I DNA/RNA helicase
MHQGGRLEDGFFGLPLHEIDGQAVEVLVDARDERIERHSVAACPGTISTFNGPPPEVLVLKTPDEEIKVVSQGLAARASQGIVPHEIGVFVRSAAELHRAPAAVEGAKLPYKVLEGNVEPTTGFASIGVMHLAKGLEFRTVVVMASDDQVIPLRSGDPSTGAD